jgi:hypothetical protein
MELKRRLTSIYLENKKNETEKEALSEKIKDI